MTQEQIYENLCKLTNEIMFDICQINGKIVVESEKLNKIKCDVEIAKQDNIDFRYVNTLLLQQFSIESIIQSLNNHKNTLEIIYEDLNERMEFISN